MDFKERVFQARKAKGYSQEDLAELVGVSRQAVSKWETGEAMPDMEKLVALCDALNLNMEYLALGKTPASPSSTPKKPLLWIGVSILAVAFFGAGFLSGYRTSPKIPPETVPQLSTVHPQQQESVSGIVTVIPPQQGYVSGPISDFNVKSVRGQKMELIILPAVLTEGMDIHVVCEDKIQNKTQTHTCSFDGTFYRLQLPRPNIFHYYLTVILERNGAKEQLPLAEIEGDKNSLLTSHLWEN